MNAGKLSDIFAFLVTIAALIVVLMLLNWVPTVFQKGLMEEYSNLELAGLQLNIKPIYTPSYFPNSLTWPPSRILAQTKPFTAIAMEFNDVESGDVALTITQSASDRLAHKSSLRILQLKKTRSYRLKGREATLDIGFCADEEPCSRISWKEGGWLLEVVGKIPSGELIKISESALPG